jgi:hypothetical protein
MLVIFPFKNLKKQLFQLSLLLGSSLPTFSQSTPQLYSFSITKNGEKLSGFKDSNGKIIIPAKYAYSFTDTLNFAAIVSSRDYKSITAINHRDSVLFEVFNYDNRPDYIEEGLFRFVENKKIGFANKEFKKIIPAQFDYAAPFEEGIAFFKMGGEKKQEGEHFYWANESESGYVNHDGELFSSVEKLVGTRRLAILKSNGQQVVLNAQGTIIRKFKSN